MEKLIKGEGDGDGGGFWNWRSESVRLYLQISTTNSGLKCMKSEDNNGRKSKHSPQLQGGLIIRMGWSSI